MLPAAALDPGVQRKLVAAIEGSGHAGATAPRIESGAPARADHGGGLHAQDVTPRRRDGVPVEEAAPARQRVMARDGVFGPPERSPRGLFRLVHNRE